MIKTEFIRNIAIIAHVDHGKTTLVDGLLKQSHTFRDNQAEMSQSLIMDSGDQEKERGITITAKITAVNYNNYRINIIDTPGHADFGGEVERTLSMADGVILVVDAQEGPMPQTKFVLAKALELKLTPIVVINKIDKPAARISEVEDELADLFLELATDEDQLHYDTFYAIARDGKSWIQYPDSPTEAADLTPIFDAVIEKIDYPSGDEKSPFRMQVAALDFDNFKGKYIIGRVERGKLSARSKVSLCNPDKVLGSGSVDGIYISNGTTRTEVEEAITGDIVAITGIANAEIGDTITNPDHLDALPVLDISDPTLEIFLGPNSSPFKGLEGKFSTSRQISDRLDRELETNVGLRVTPSGIGFNIAGRGELHLSVLIETMRREGYEFEVGRPSVITKDIDGVVMEPIEELIIEVSSEFVGAIQTELGKRRANLKEQTNKSSGAVQLVYELPTRAMLGLRGLLITATKGTVIINSLNIGHQPLGASLDRSRNGVLVAFETGTTTAYSLQNAEARGTIFIGPGVKVYAGQIIGLNSRYDDLEINVTKEKHLTNMRSSSSDGVVQLTPPTTLSLEQCIDFIEEDELLEVTPENLRLRKSELDPNKRKRANKK